MSDDNEKYRQDRQFELKFKADYEEYQKCKMYYQENQYKAYILIWERYATAMNSKIEARKYFEDDIYNDPVKFLRVINQYALNYQEARCKMLVV